MYVFFFNDTATTEIYTLSLHDALPILLMMNTRAKASIHLAEGRFGDAIKQIERGRDAITEFYQQSSFPEMVNKSSELAFLERSEEHTSELQSRQYLVCRLLLEKKHTST